MSKAIKTLGKQTLYKATATAFDNYGDPTLGTASSFLGMVEIDRSWRESGIEKANETVHKIYTNTAIEMDNAIWLPDMNKDTDPPRYPKNVFVAYRPGTSVISHYEVTI